MEEIFGVHSSNVKLLARSYACLAGMIFLIFSMLMIQFAYQAGPPSTLQYHTLFYYLYYCCSYTVASVSPQFPHLPSLDSIILAYSHHFLQLFLIASAPLSFPTPPSLSSVCTLLSSLPTAVACSFSTLSFPTPTLPQCHTPFYHLHLLLFHIASASPWFTNPHLPLVAYILLSPLPTAIAHPTFPQ